MGSGPSPPRSGPQSSGSPQPRPQRPARAAARSMRPAWVWDGSNDVAVARCHRAGDRLNSGSQSIVSDGPRGSLRRKQRPLSEEEKHHATGTVVRIAPRTTHPGCTPDPLVCGISYPRRKTGRVKEYGVRDEYGTGIRDVVDYVNFRISYFSGKRIRPSLRYHGRTVRGPLPSQASGRGAVGAGG